MTRLLTLALTVFSSLIGNAAVAQDWAEFSRRISGCYELLEYNGSPVTQSSTNPTYVTDDFGLVAPPGCTASPDPFSSAIVIRAATGEHMVHIWIMCLPYEGEDVIKVLTEDYAMTEYTNILGRLVVEVRILGEGLLEAHSHDGDGEGSRLLMERKDCR
jgi:hypothetical protein